MASRSCRCLFVVLILLMGSSPFHITRNQSACAKAQEVRVEDDLYELLEVSRTATTKDIKSAYRRKALDTHPDKRKDIPPEQAAEEFHKVVRAFEILSDETTRHHYDQTGWASPRTQDYNNQQQQYQNQQQQHHQWHSERNVMSRRRRLKIQEAMSRVLYVHSLDHLKSVMLDDNGNLERHLLICFVTLGAVDQISHTMSYPFPFAGYSEGGIFWETMLQTTKVVYTQPNDLTQFFHIHTKMYQPQQPIFLFGRRGEPLSPNLPRIKTANVGQFKEFVWSKIQATVTFVNKHPHPVIGFWHRGEVNKARELFRLQPEETVEITTVLSHEFWVKDARVDSFPESPRNPQLAQEALVGIYNIVSDDEGQVIVIEPKSCFDFSGYCREWKQEGGCAREQDKEFMHEVCPFSCRMCTDDEDAWRLMGFGGSRPLRWDEL